MEGITKLIQQLKAKEKRQAEALESTRSQIKELETVNAKSK